MALAALMGGGAYQRHPHVAAIKLPNQFRQIFGEGSFNAAYLPTYTRVLEARGPEEAGGFASQVFTLLILSQIALLGLVYLDMPLLVRLTSPGFVSQPDKFAQAVAMSRIMFPYIAFIACVFSRCHQGTLNANNACRTPRFRAGRSQSVHDRVSRFRRLVSEGLARRGQHGELGISRPPARHNSSSSWPLRAGAGYLERLTWPRWTPRVRKFLWMLGPARSAFRRVIRSARLADPDLGSRSYPPAVFPPSATPTGSIELPGGVIVIATGSVLLREMSALVALGDAQGAMAAQGRALALR